MKKNIAIFLSGCIFGFAILFASAFYSVQKNKGKPLVAPKVYGNIKIFRPKLSDQGWLRDEHSVIIEKNGENIISMSFDEDNNIASASYLREGELLFIADSLNKGHQTHSYGNIYKYKDYNCDGTFDYYDCGMDRNIFVKDTWLKVKKISGRDAIIADGDGERVFVFDSEDGWVEKVE